MKRLEGVDEADINEAVEFPSVPNPPAFQAILTLTDSLVVAMQSPFPVLAHKILSLTPSMRQAKKAKNDYIGGELAKADRRFTEDKNSTVRCGMEYVLKREVARAKKEGRKPVYHTTAIYDEVRQSPNPFLIHHS